MNFWIEGEPEALAEVLKRVDLLVINDEEARQLSGIHNIVQGGAQTSAARGPKHAHRQARRVRRALLRRRRRLLRARLSRSRTWSTRPAPATRSPARSQATSPRPAISRRPGMRRAIIVGSAAASYCVEAVGTAKIGRVGISDISTRLDLFRNLMHVTHDNVAT